MIYNPVELLKVRAQVNRQDFVRYRTAVPELISNEGAWALYKGLGPLFWRDVPGWGVYFFSYDCLQRAFGIQEAKKNGTEYSKLNIAIKIWCGGVAGQLSWVVGMPFDVIKTQIQCTESRWVPAMEVSRRIFAEEGVQGFFKGFSPTLARSFIVNGVTLPAFEYLNNKYCKSQED